MFYCSCKQHTHTMSVKALVGSHPCGYPCRICSKKADSKQELQARGALQVLGVDFQVYPKVLGGKFGAADIFVPSAQLIIAVDGPQHLFGDCKTVCNALQRKRDASFDSAALQQGKRLLRLHCRDVELGDAGRYIRWALKFCSLKPHLCFRMYSKRYRAAGWQPLFVTRHAP